MPILRSIALGKHGLCGVSQEQGHGMALTESLRGGFSFGWGGYFDFLHNMLLE